MGPENTLPHSPLYGSSENYVEALLEFVTTSDMLQTLCGGVHILDFLTREPDLFDAVLPSQWRDWLRLFEISDVLDLLMREDLTSLIMDSAYKDLCPSVEEPKKLSRNESRRWRGGPVPPESLLDYIYNVRSLTLDRTFMIDNILAEDPSRRGLSRQLSVGMKPKKAHEVENFAAFVDGLVSELAATNSHQISHLVDFGSGQNYLGRVLASPLYDKKVIAVESKQSNITGAIEMDISARLAKKPVIQRNKKAFRQQEENKVSSIRKDMTMLKQIPPPAARAVLEETQPREAACRNFPDSRTTHHGSHNIQYVEHIITDGNLEAVITEVNSKSTAESTNGAHKTNSTRLDRTSYSDPEPQLMVVSLHSCGNLVHHGLRSLFLNESVKAVAMVGCCYNLVTERLGPPTCKLPIVRPFNLRLERSSCACDPHGFPMSDRLASYKHRHGEGIRMNITARMMAVQAPQNWTSSDCEGFFTRHFFRALLQRVFIDRGVVQVSARSDDVLEASSPRGWSGGGQPIIIGSLRKACYASFPAYVRGAMAKIGESSEQGLSIKRRLADLSESDLLDYYKRFEHKKHELSLIWSLMAFSAGVMESVIVVDRWLYLKEQQDVSACWVQTVFEHEHSPRNFVVVGVKK
ncbi:hypothetical protein MMC13_002172 [Lambiella insularis]|nr:hypothetical protein [Lambiella insularis]